MIAKSKDGGRTWETRHTNPSGEALLTMEFLEGGIGIAAGTHGLLLKSTDGGETWAKFGKGQDTIREVAFADEQNGLASTDTGVKETEDGGETWKLIGAYEVDKQLAEMNIAGLGKLDKTHSAVLYRGDGEPVLAITENGGQSWSVEAIHNSGLWALVMHHGEFWMFGYEVIEKDKPGGGYGVALSLHSRDGKHWEHGVRAPNEFSDCTTQGCILWDGAIVELYGATAGYRSVPADGTLSPKWAIAQDSLCSIRTSLACAPSTQVPSPTPRPQFNRPTSGSIDPFLAKESRLAKECISCRLEPFPVEKKNLGSMTATVNLPSGQQRTITMPGIQTIVTVKLVTQKDGTVTVSGTKNSPNKKVEEELSKAVSEWIMVPPRVDGEAADAKHEIKIGVSCMAFPSNDEALCTLMLR